MAQSKILEQTTGQRLRKLMRDVGKGTLVPNPDAKSNLGTTLHKLFIWQELAKLADTELKLQWKVAQAQDGICDEDDVLREQQDIGETEICNSSHYALVVEVKTPAERIDQKEFYKLLAKQFKSTPAKIAEVAERAKVENKAALSKKIVERV